MKLLLTAFFALIGAILMPLAAFADTKIVDGCEVATVPGTNYSNLVDPTCSFDSASTEGDTPTPGSGFMPAPSI